MLYAWFYARDHILAIPEPVRICVCHTAVITKMENKIHQLQLQAVNELALQFCFIQLFIVIARAHSIPIRTHTVAFAFID